MYSYLLDQVKQVMAIKQLLALAKGVVDVFRIEAFRKIFLRHALPAEHSLALRATTSAPSDCISRHLCFHHGPMFVLQIHRQRLEPAAATRACAILQLCHHAGVHA
jgi:hypothetical protein